MKIKCEICGNVGQLQHLSKNYYRVKHYLGSVDGKLKFEYHKQSPQYIQSLVSKPSPIQIDPKTIDPKSLNSGSLNQVVGGRSLAWLGHRLPKPTTRVQIPVTAPYHLFRIRLFSLNASSIVLAFWRLLCDRINSHYARCSAGLRSGSVLFK